MDARWKERMQSSSMCNSIQWSQNVYIHGKTPENYVEKWIEFYLLGSSDYVWFPAFAISFCIARIILTKRKKKKKNDSKGYWVSVFSWRWTMDTKMSRIQWSRSWDMEVKRPLLAWGESSNCEIYLPECGYASPSSLTFIGSLLYSQHHLNSCMCSLILSSQKQHEIVTFHIPLLQKEKQK